MPGHKSILLVAILCICIDSGCNAQPPQKIKKSVSDTWSILCCFNFIKKQLAGGTYKILIGSGGRYQYNGREIVANENELSVYNNGERLKLQSDSNDIAEWTDIVNWDSVKLYGLNIDSVSYLIASSSISQPTGLATNFYKWLIVDLNTGDFFIVWSLSNDPSFFYNSKGNFEFYLFDYSSDFLDKRDFDHVSLFIVKNRIEAGRLIELKRIVRNCTCN